MNAITFVEGWAIPRRVLVLLGVAVFVELFVLATRIEPMFRVAFVGVPWSLLPCLVALALILHHPHRLTLVINDARALAYVALSVLAIVFGSLYVSSNGFDTSVAIVVAVGVEEVVYRLAIPIVFTLIAVRLGMHERPALLLALGVSVLLFAAMPGHVEQLTDVRSWSSFVAFTILMSHAVWRGNSLFAPVVAHAVYDFATLGMQDGDIS
jgi:hypothetical protein